MAPAYTPAPGSSAIFRPLTAPSLFSSLSSTSPTAPTAPPSAQQEEEPAQPAPESFELLEPLEPLARPRHDRQPLRHRDILQGQCGYRARYGVETPSNQTRTDLGDDDSFSPEIVSGYQFNVPLARETSAIGTDAFGLEEEPLAGAFEDEDVEPVAHRAAPLARGTPLRGSPRDFEPEPDHRADAVYDDLDDIGDWVANTAPPAMDLTKKLARAVSRSVALNGPMGATGAVAVANSALSVHQRAEDKRRENQGRDKLDRATVEQVLDPRTRMILFRLLSRNRLRTLDGCVSTGKEANVYYGTAASDPNSLPDSEGQRPPNPGLTAHDYSPDAPVAVKVFKTSVLQFKDRERYVAGEFRFRRGGYQRGSNRKMVQQWAEKEFRNQMRLQEAGIPAPIPLLLKPPVLVMSFFGKDGWPAPRIKDAALSPSRLAKAYFRVCILMRRMFRVAHLVHGDLSEYNMLYWKGEVIIIDVSQSVEDDHPMALDFLRRDCANINDYFRRAGGVSVLTVRELFDFVTGEHIGDQRHEEESALSFLLDAAAERDAEAGKAKQNDDDVFMQSYIPRTLQEVELRDQEFQSRPSDDLDRKLYAKLTGLTLTQKRERVAARLSKSPSISEESHIAASLEGSHLGGSDGGPVVGTVGSTEWEGTRDPYTFGVDDESGIVNVPNLEVPCVEPATVRTLPAPDKVRIRSSSPCTSNSSSRPTAEEIDVARRFSRAADDKKTDDLTYGVGSSSIYNESVGSASGSRGPRAQLFEDNGESESSSGDVWLHKPPAETADPYMGLTKKEWKKRVKAEAREKREHKVPKHVKKRKETLAKRRRSAK